jgi:SAM-dependent methyltransferase
MARGAKPRGGKIPPSAAERDEWDAAQRTLPTARPWPVVAALIPFPTSVTGLTIVDVGAGGSDAVPTLLEAGARAFGVDPRYRSLDNLVHEVTLYFRTQEAIGQLPAAREASARPIAAQRAAFRHLVASFQAPRTARHYLPAVATRLPFPRASVDLLYSLDCITQYLDREFESLLAAVQEGLRVLRRGGVLALVPFRDDIFAAGYHPERHASQERLLAWLAESHLSWSLEDLSPTGLTGSSRLEIRAS